MSPQPPSLFLSNSMIMNCVRCGKAGWEWGVDELHFGFLERSKAIWNIARRCRRLKSGNCNLIEFRLLFPLSPLLPPHCLVYSLFVLPDRNGHSNDFVSLFELFFYGYFDVLLYGAHNFMLNELNRLMVSDYALCVCYSCVWIFVGICCNRRCLAI